MGNESINIHELIFAKHLENNNALEPINFAVDVLTREVVHYLQAGILQSELKNLLEIESELNRYANKMHIFDNSDLQEAYKLGIFKTFITIVESKANESDKVDSLFEIVERNKHFIDIIFILYQRNSITHKELAKSLNISTSGLSNLMNKIEHYDLFYYEYRGKYKYYYANYKTKTFYKQYVDRSINKTYTQSEFFKFLNIFISILNEEIYNTSRINANSILNRICINDDLCRSNDMKISIQNLAKTINEKIETNYSNNLVVSIDVDSDDCYYLPEKRLGVLYV